MKNFKNFLNESYRKLRVGDKVLNSFDGIGGKYLNQICTITRIGDVIYLVVDSDPTGYESRFCSSDNWEKYLTIIDDEIEEQDYEEWSET